MNIKICVSVGAHQVSEVVALKIANLTRPDREGIVELSFEIVNSTDPLEILTVHCRRQATLCSDLRRTQIDPHDLFDAPPPQTCRVAGRLRRPLPGDGKNRLYDRHEGAERPYCVWPLGCVFGRPRFDLFDCGL